MIIYLLQHGIALPKVEDPERGLSEEGMADVRRIAEVAAAYKVQVSKIVHSGKKRAKQTAEIYAEHLKNEPAIEESALINPNDDIRSFAVGLIKHNMTMFVGHLPFMEKLTSYLTSGQDERTVFKFQNGGIVCLESEEKDTTQWSIKWALMPNIG